MALRRILTTTLVAASLALGGLAATAAPAEAAPRALVTKSEFGQVKDGMTVVQVRTIFDSNGKNTTGVPESGLEYEWKTSTSDYVVVQFTPKGRVTDKYWAAVASKSEYKKLKKGMSQRRARKIIDGGGVYIGHYVEGGRVGGPDVRWYWHRSTGGKHVWVAYKGGKVARAFRA